MILTKVIKPAHPFKSSVFRKEVDRDAKVIGKEMLEDFERTTTTWRERPRFKLKVQSSGTAGVSISVTTKSKKWNWTDKGTRAHTITAHTKKGLIFRVGGESKTEPNMILSVPGRLGDEWRRKRKVHHPGTRPRNFTKIIKHSFSPEFRRKMQAALNRAAARFNKGEG